MIARRETPRRWLAWLTDLARRDYDVALVAVVALAVRAVYLLELRQIPFFDSPVVDAADYFAQARLIAAGRLLSDEAFWQAPLYQYLLGLAIGVVGPSHLVLHSLHFLLGAVNCGLTVLLGRRVFGRWPGLIAGLAAALYGPLIFFEGEYLAPVLATFLNLLLLLALIRAARVQSLGAFLAAGLLLGLSALAASTILLFAPVAAALFYFSALKAMTPARRLYRVGLLAMACVAAIAPTTLHNWVTSHELVFISSNSGVNFYIGNNRDWRKTVGIRPGLAWGDLVARPFQAGAVKPGERSRYFSRAAWADIEADPLAAVGRMAVKLGQFWRGQEYVRNVDPRLYRRSSRLLSLLLWEGPFFFPFGLVAPLALGGAIVVLRDRALERRLLLGFILSNWVAISIFFVTARYRVPIVPALLVLAAYFTLELGRRFRTEARKTPLALAGVAAALAVACNYGAGATAPVSDYEAGLFLGQAALARGQAYKAILEYQLALAADPQNPEPSLRLGEAFLAVGELAPAEQRFESALAMAGPEMTSARAWALEQLGHIADARGDSNAALERYSASLQAFGSQYGARLGKARALKKLGRLDEALAELDALAARYPLHPEPWKEKGRLLLERGRTPEALVSYQRSVELFGRDPEARVGLALALIRSGDKKRARAELEIAVKLAPQLPMLRSAIQELSR